MHYYITVVAINRNYSYLFILSRIKFVNEPDHGHVSNYLATLVPIGVCGMNKTVSFGQINASTYYIHPSYDL